MIEFSEVELDAWFAVRGVRRADIRARLAPFASSDWLYRFPRYVEGLGKQAAYYDAVVAAAFIHQHAIDAGQGPAHRLRALEQAHDVFRAPEQGTHLSDIELLRCLYRVSLEICATFRPPPDVYELPDLDSGAYDHLAPLPERAAFADSSTEAASSDEDMSVSSVDAGAPAVVVRGRGRGRPRGRGRSRGRARGRGRSS